MKKEDGTVTENDKDNMIFKHPHLQKVFNNHQPTYFIVLDLIKQ